MSLHLVSSDAAIQEYVNNTVESRFAAGDPLRTLQSWSYTDRAEKGLRQRRENGVPIHALIIDTDARGEPSAAGLSAAGAQSAGALLRALAAGMPELPIVLAVRSAGGDLELESILREQVWTWNTAPEQAEERLAAVLRVATSKPAGRRSLCATICFERDAEYLSIHEKGIEQLRRRPLLDATRDRFMRRALNRLAADDLEPYVNDDDLARCWDKLSATGQDLFNTLFNSARATDLLRRDIIASLEFRFEITKDALPDRFGLPLELLSNGDVRNDFLCRLRPMARRVGTLQSAAAPPACQHVLFVDAGSAAGHSDVLDERTLKPTGFMALQAAADAQYEALAELAGAGRCTVERWTMAAFIRDYPDGVPGTSFADALRRRLEEPAPGHAAIDVLHFSGHGLTPKGGETRLVLPGKAEGDIELLRIGRLAGWLPASLRLVFLGACQSMSASTAEHLHVARRCSVVGFRWEIQAARIPAFAAEFYRAHLAGRRSVATAYCAACHETADDVHTVWASAMALTSD